MDRIRQSFRRKRNKHKQPENTFDVQNVFDSVEGEEDPKPLSRIDKIRKSIRTLKRKKKKNAKDSDDRESVDEELDGNNDDNINFDTNDEDTIDERIDDFSDKDEIDEVVLDKKTKFRFSFRKKKNKEKEVVVSSEEKKKAKQEKKKKKKKGSGKWDHDEERVRSNHCEYKVNYLGSLEVQESRGMEVCEAAIKTLLNAKEKPIKGKLHVTGDGLRVVDKKGGMLVDQVIEKVSFCAPDRNHHHGFAYISRDGTSRRWLCHGFMARKDSGERLSHAVGVAFAVCLENKQSREREGVTASYNEEEGTFTRFGSFRQGTITERLQNPQEFKESVEKSEVGAVDNPFAIARPRPGDARASMRVLGDIRGASPFKRGAADYSSLRVNELPSNISRKEKSRVSLILEENFENEETKNEINELLLQMSQAKILEQKQEEDMKTSTSSQFSSNSPNMMSTSPAMSIPPTFESSNSLFPAAVVTSNDNDNALTKINSISNNNNVDNEVKEDPAKSPEVTLTESSNPWDLVPDQTKIKIHSRSNSKHENIKLEPGNTTGSSGWSDPMETSGQGDKWLASLTDKISSLDTDQATQGWSTNNVTAGDLEEAADLVEDPLENEWAALANRNEVKSAKNNNNPFIAFV